MDNKKTVIESINRVCEDYCDITSRLRELDKRHADVLTAADRECRRKIQELTNGRNRAITQAKNGRAARETALDVMTTRIEELKEKAASLPVYEDDSFGDQEVDHFDWKGLEDLAAKVSDTSLIARVKGLLYSGGYKPKNELLSEYARELRKAEIYMDRQRALARETVKNAESRSSELLSEEMGEARLILKNAISEENEAYDEERSLLVNRLEDITSGKRFKTIADGIRRDYRIQRGTVNSLVNSVPGETKSEKVYFASQLIEVDLPEDLLEVFKGAFGTLCRYPNIRVPFSVSPFSQSIVFEYTSASRASMLSAANCFVLRILSLCKPEEIQIVYLDPLGAGTSSNKLTALRGLTDNASLRIGGNEKDAEELLDVLLSACCSCSTADGQTVSRHTVLVLCDYPLGFSVKAIETASQLFTAGRNISFVVMSRKSDYRSTETDIAFETMRETSVILSEKDTSVFAASQEGSDFKVVLPQIEKIPDVFFATIERALKDTHPNASSAAVCIPINGNGENDEGGTYGER